MTALVFPSKSIHDISRSTPFTCLQIFTPELSLIYNQHYRISPKNTWFYKKDFLNIRKVILVQKLQKNCNQSLNLQHTEIIILKRVCD
ncbi:hypothetical protein CN326_21385 [Bacillus sp. AFS018417]|nr:hypothetical protein CN326_21385 [Bacillus sp. AFS018417]